ncbi:hypothetical protein WICMUC_000033 [Wickerhamomyces mucosus]|uniref:Oxidoreductase-like domain-containing protein n=1 Tax=Wickerhamomyces mucosus TaxID=1378264 RepID=A0A9P8Q0C2_9ASCO|nr:hypothetical protein WICMUC_000033 [Wickerhamomyces mucosus]
MAGIIRTTKLSKSLFSTTIINQSLTFQTNHEVLGTAEERMKDVFGGRIKGDDRVSSSRKELSEERVIGGILITKKPIEPDNCCMSGCVNCVWEQYNDDLRHWRDRRREAAAKINQTNEIWPADYNPPLSLLNIKNLPDQLKERKRKSEEKPKITTASYFPVIGKPGAQNLTNNVDEEEAESWKDVPVSFKVFAETEKLIKSKHRKKDGRNSITG